MSRSSSLNARRTDPSFPPCITLLLGAAVLAGCGGAAGEQDSGGAGRAVLAPGTGGAGGASGSSSVGTGGSAGASGASTGSAGSTAGTGSAAGGAAGATGSGVGGAAGGSMIAGASGSTPPPPPGSCAMTADRTRITEVDVGSAVLTGDSDQTFFMLAISPIPSGGSRLAWLSGDGNVHLAQLDADDHLVGAPFSLPAHDFSDLYADDQGGVVLLTRDAQGGGNHNCGNIDNLCGNSASYPTDYACYDMYLVRFDGTAETWATKLTDSSAARPPYGTSPTETNRTTFIWEWYGHHGRIVSDGSRWAAYYGASLSGSSMALTGSGCAQSDSTLSAGIDIHQGDQMRVVDGSGAVQAGGFDWGCSHSYYERVVYDSAAKKFVPICETDASNQLRFAPPSFAAGGTIYAIDMQREIGNYSDIGNLVLGAQGGYWTTVSKSRAAAAGMADVHLLHFTTGAPDVDLVVSNDTTLNNRSNHLAKYGSSRLLAAWETASAPNDFSPFTAARKFYLRMHDATTGEPEGDPLQVSINGNRYDELRDYPDGSVAYPAAGSSNTKIAILRVLPCD